LLIFYHKRGLSQLLWILHQNNRQKAILKSREIGKKINLCYVKLPPELSVEKFPWGETLIFRRFEIFSVSWTRVHLKYVICEMRRVLGRGCCSRPASIMRVLALGRNHKWVVRRQWLAMQSPRFMGLLSLSFCARDAFRCTRHRQFPCSAINICNRSDAAKLQSMRYKY